MQFSKSFSLTRNKWTDKSKGKLILHGMFGNSDFLPSVSPFVLKLETFLRFANIPYETDKSDMWGPKGKTPWISLNGHHIGDSQLIIEFLKTYENVIRVDACDYVKY